jgi:co-chaperonin GroES (HSP10)
LVAERKLITFIINKENMSKIRPLNGHVVIRPIEEEEQTYGNIVVPDMGKEKANTMIVVSVSDTYNWHTGQYCESKLKPGQKVIVPPLGGVRVSIDGEDYFHYKETEILSILED